MGIIFPTLSLIIIGVITNHRRGKVVSPILASTYKYGYPNRADKSRALSTQVFFFQSREKIKLKKMSSSLNPRYYRTAKVEEIEKKTERPMECFTREIQRPNSTNVRKPAAAPKKLESKPSEDINESAENFIKKFKQQLLLQRLESMENYEQMLKRGT
ncbi:hypothetical protein RDI58_008953 [Solanum bulbocastanum]|uniref:Uncharacterized protein n=1 Tax=Solanum bulbocastanum TaxID=147425 RepID=A0AAN8TWT4_SOLBU